MNHLEPSTMSLEAGLLKVDGLFKSFGGLTVINDLSFSLAAGEIVGIIGPNGSGKTTLFNLITGFLRPDRGTIVFQDRDIGRQRPSRLCQSGLTRTFQIVRPFLKLTVLENVISGCAFGRQPIKDMKLARQTAEEVLDFIGLPAKRDLAAERLNLLDRKRLEIARALATRPRLMLLDEVFAGLNHHEIEAALELVTRIHQSGLTLMIVEHLMKVILGVSNRVIVLSHGQKIFEGAPTAAVEDRRVIEAYLGENFHA